MILEKIQLINFKCFEDHTVHLTGTSILIGENNAGKSTIVEALRVISLACVRLKSIAIYNKRPNWLDTKPLAVKGVKITNKAIDVELDMVFNRYNDPPAIIKAIFSNELMLEIFIKSEKDIFVIATSKKKVLCKREMIIKAGLPDINVLPQIVPLLKEEELVGRQTLERNKFSKRTSRNFRNNLLLNYKSKLYRDFTLLIQETWGGIRIQELIKEQNSIALQLRDRDFVTEIYNMGHGVQMWLQTMWFLTCAKEDSIIVLDEPDVYMHADMQRRLIRLLKNKYNQTIIATHSVEIMSEVQPNNIVIINRKNDESLIADSYPIIQKVLSSLGSIHNISLARILNNKKYLYVEGDDKKLLSTFYDKLFPNTKYPFDHIASTSTGGWGSWDIQKVKAKSLLKELPELKVHFLYDRDYHTEEEIEERLHDARSSGIRMRIWNKKEIENYLIKAKPIAKTIFDNYREKSIEELCKDIECLISDTCEEMKEETFDKHIAERLRRERHKEYPTVKAELKPDFELKWKKDKVAIVSGKRLISLISEKCSDIYGVVFGASRLASAIDKEDIDQEIIHFLTVIHGSK